MVEAGAPGRGGHGRGGHERDGHERDGHEFEGLLGLVCGLAMAFGRGRSARLVAEAAGVGSGDRVVDVGCGPGRFLREAAERGATVVGIDPSAQMRRLALWRTPGRLRPAVTVINGSAERLPLDDGMATVVWAVASFHHWGDPVAGLAEVRRVLEPGGRLLVAERLAGPGGWFRQHALTWEQAKSLAVQLGQAGFADVTVDRQTLGRRQLVLVQGRRPADST